MSEASEQAEDLRKLAQALLQARESLSAAEAAADAYAGAVKAGTQQLSIARAAEIEAEKAVAKARAASAEAALRAEADGTAAAKRAAKASADSAKAAEEAARATAAAEKTRAAAVAESSAKLGKLKELAIGATGGEEAVEKWKKGTEALKLAGDKSLTTGQRFVAGAAAAKNFALAASTVAGAVVSAGAALIEFSGEVDSARARTEQYQQRLGALGGSLSAINAATAGAADTQVAFNMQFALADRGISASAAQMGTLAAATRDYARSRQVSQEQASQVILRAFDGESAALAQLGVRTDGVTNASQRHTAVLAALTQRQREYGVAQQDATEKARLREQAEQRIGDSVKANVGGALLYLVPFVREYRMHVNTMADVEVRQREVAATTGTLSAEQRKLNEDLAKTARIQQDGIALATARADDERRAAALAQNAANDELRRLGEHVTGMTSVISAQDQYNQALREANTLQRRAGEELPAFEQRRLQATNNLIAAVRRKNDEQTRRDTLDHQRVELGLLAQQIRSHGGAFSERVRSLTPAQRLLELQRQIAGFSQRENETLEQANTRLLALAQEYEQRRSQAASEAAARIRAQEELARASRDLREETDLAYRLGIRIAEVERRRGETGIEYINRRLEAQRALNEVDAEARDMETERLNADLAAAQNKEEQRTIAEGERRRNIADAEYEAGLERERQRAAMNAATVDRERADQVENRLRDAFGLAEENSRTATQSMAAGAKAAYDAFGELGAGIAGAIKSATESGEDVGAAVAKQVDEWAGAKALQWGLQSLEALAGAGMAYFIRPDAVPGLLASAAQYAGLAAAAGVTAAAIPNAPAASAGSGGSGSGDRGLGMASSMRSESAATTKAPAPMVFNVSGFTSTESAQEGIVRALSEAQARGLISRSWS